MAELTDYSGDFDPEFSHENLSKGTLLKLLHMYNGYLQRVDAYWYLNVMEKWGNDEAFEIDVKVWERAQLWEMKAVSKAFNIQGDDVTTLVKYMQVSPWMWIYKSEIDLKSPKHAVVTITHCPTLLSLEKEGTGREEPICRDLETKMMEVMAHHFNPDIQVNALKLPPRTDYKDCCCQWEFKL